MKTSRGYDSLTSVDYDPLLQRCLTYLRCWSISEIQRLELALKAVRSVSLTGEGSAASAYGKALQQLRLEVGRCMPTDSVLALPAVNRKSMPAADLSVSAKKHIPKPKKSNRFSISSLFNRKLFLAILVFMPAFLAAWGISTVLPYHGATRTEQLLVVISGLLFAWVSVGFWVAMVGSIVTLRGRGNSVGLNDLDVAQVTIPPTAKTAILFPLCGEDMRRVSAGIFSVYQSLRKTGQIQYFDFYLLSDSRDSDAWITEEVFWRQLCSDLGEPGNIFYRRRRLNLKRKSGNVADFCRRYGANYRYMVVFDADSIMSGQTLIKLVHLMEQNPQVGIIQTPPTVVGKDTLLARVQQFCSRAYGPIYAAGLHWFQQGDGSFWGHNAILRVDPFMRHCGLPRLPGRAPWGGDILSHDFVESALMRRGGYHIWLAYDLEGSYEEPPPTLSDELKRDRRWCSGNLQHMRFVFTKGFSAAHRWLFINGIMSYLSAALWFLLLLLSSVSVVENAFSSPDYFPSGPSLFPHWPVWDPYAPALLLAITATLLFLPKLLAIVTIVLQGKAPLFGGGSSLLASVMVEMIISASLAPIRMVFHARFVLMMLFRRQSGWNPQNRGDMGTRWGEALSTFCPCTLLAVFWGGVTLLVNQTFFWWLSPVLIPLLLAIPLAVFTSRSSVGMKARKFGLLLTPEEIEPPAELVTLANKHRDLGNAVTPLRLQATDGFIRAVLNPQINTLHRRLRGRMTRSKISADKRFLLLRKALNSGPEELSEQEKKRFLQDNLLLWMLHKWVWAQPDGDVARKWFGRYTQRSL